MEANRASKWLVGLAIFLTWVAVALLGTPSEQVRIQAAGPVAQFPELTRVAPTEASTVCPVPIDGHNHTSAQRRASHSGIL